MKLTIKTEYALLALVYLARHDGPKYISGEIIAKEEGIPEKFLQQILLALKRARCVQSTKGHHGGYRLAREADKITLAEVIRLFDGALAPTESVSKYFFETTPVSKEEKLSDVFRDLRDYTARKLENTTLQDVM
jgi:Rrf2 family cysteine metabolism transcriptional repressor